MYFPDRALVPANHQKTVTTASPHAPRRERAEVA